MTEQRDDSREGEEVTTARLADSVRPQRQQGGELPPGVPTGDGSTFKPGDLLSGRFRITRLLGRGGMGEVYEARDLELDQDVAVKTVLPGVARNEEAMARFRREIQLARQVTHPNVCRIFDIFHHAGATPQESTMFLTMELLPGCTLAELIRDRGRLSTAEALPIVEQIAAALSAAHRAKVIHRDLKSSNVMLVPGEDGTTRAVVTDFGIARSVGDGGLGASLTVSGMVLGSPAYMAPEQVRGLQVTEASDVYSLGVLLYEMITGRLPFSGDSPLSVAVARLETAPAPLRTHLPGIDVTWEAAILRCLETDPSDRFASVDEVARALAGQEVAPSAGSRRRLRKRLGLAAAALALLSLLAGTLLLRPRPRPAVAVLGFSNISKHGDLDWLSGSLTVMLGTELGAGGRVRLIPDENVSLMRDDLSLLEVRSYGQDTLHKIRSYLGADYLVMGTYSPLASSTRELVRIDLRLQDARTGQTEVSDFLEGRADDVPDLVARAAQLLRPELGVADLDADERVAADALLPASREAIQRYAEGLASLHMVDAVTARDRLQEAVAADPDNPLAFAALADAWKKLGYDARAMQAAEKAISLASDLAHWDRLEIEARYHFNANQWQEAITAYGELCAYFQDDLELGLQLAAAQTLGGSGEDALLTLDRLRSLPPPAGNDSRIDLAEARTAGAMGDTARQLELARRAVQGAERVGARMIAARARSLESTALLRRGELNQAMAASERAREIFASAGNLIEAAEALAVQGRIAEERGDLARARLLQEKALDTQSTAGYELGVATRLLEISRLCSRQGDVSGAKERLRQALGIFRKVENRSYELRALNDLASALLTEGDHDEALLMFTEGLAVARQISDRSIEATILANIANIDLMRGDLAAAGNGFSQAGELFEASGDRASLAYATAGLGRVRLEQDRLGEARTSLERAVAVCEEIGQPIFAAINRLELARLAAGQGRPAESETVARQAAEEFAAAGIPDYEAYARAIWGDALLDQERPAEARQVVEQAESLVQSTGDAEVRLTVAITAARLQAATGDLAGASEAFAATMAEARRAGAPRFVLAAGLAQGCCELAAGHLQTGRSRLQGVMEAAQEAGFLRIAQQAKASLGNGPDPVPPS